eukprot:TRINITY_DN16076_c0_g1_i1.p1 TRINITY_DN16076_c0_g1~~TRINITY_DN16076_c0_g1_i1.p1  ORF type:complete len:140 (+),score=35.72 TRINITY_DN16076_c0_g1_i1:349-768(+)
MNLAGVPLPVDRDYDGIDMTPILVGNSETLDRDCLFHYNTRELPDGTPGLYAVRCGAYKAHYWSVDGGPQSTAPLIRNNPPLVFNLDIDPSEEYPVDATSQEWIDAFIIIDAARTEHLSSIAVFPSEIGRGEDPNLQLC